MKSNHLNIGVYTFKFLQLQASKVLISEGSFYVPSVKYLHNMCSIQYHFRNCKWHKIIAIFFIKFKFPVILKETNYNSFCSAEISSVIIYKILKLCKKLVKEICNSGNFQPFK